MTILKADDQAATRLLKAAVRKAREQIAAGQEVSTTYWRDGERVTQSRRDYNRNAVVDMLTEAGRSAELLIGGGRHG